MRRISGKNRLLRKVLKSGLSCIKAIFRAIANFIRFGIEQLLFELSLASLVIGLSYLFSVQGISPNVSLLLAIAILIVGLLLVAMYVFYRSNRNKRSNGNRYRGETGLARLISRTIAERESTQWHEYQDWLHDILLSRRQLLDAKHPRWKVSLVTYWRLSTFCLVVGINKVKQVTVKSWRSR